jgi:hypothetical protein
VPQTSTSKSAVRERQCASWRHEDGCDVHPLIDDKTGACGSDARPAASEVRASTDVMREMRFIDPVYISHTPQTAVSLYTSQ